MNKNKINFNILLSKLIKKAMKKLNKAKQNEIMACNFLLIIYLVLDCESNEFNDYVVNFLKLSLLKNYLGNNTYKNPIYEILLKKLMINDSHKPPYPQANQTLRNSVQK